MLSTLNPYDPTGSGGLAYPTLSSYSNRRMARPVTFDPRTARALADVQADRRERVQSSAALTARLLELVKSGLVGLLRFVVHESGSLEGDQIGDRLCEIVRSAPGPVQDILMSVAQDSGQTLGIRTEAARLVARVFPEGNAALVLSKSPVSLVRVGIALGWADAAHWTGVQTLAEDSDSDVSEEARFLLENESCA